MHRMRTLAAGLAVAVSLGSGAMTLAPTALAAAARPEGVGTFHSWRAAQRAAGFGLIRPGNTYGLRRNGLISVVRCQASGQMSKRDVFASYGSFLAAASCPSGRTTPAGRAGTSGPPGSLATTGSTDAGPRCSACAASTSGRRAALARSLCT